MVKYNGILDSITIELILDDHTYILKAYIA